MNEAMTLTKAPLKALSKFAAPLTKKAKGGMTMKYCGSVEGAFAAATTEAASRQCVCIPGTAYKQGGRPFIATAMNYKQFVNITKTDSAVKGDDPESHRNRPVEDTHISGIHNYLNKNDTYILPAFAITTEHNINFYSSSADDTTPIHFGWFVIPSEAEFFIQDGQHRRMALASGGLINPGCKLAEDGAAVVISVEEDIDQIQQDFADCANVKPINAALLAVYNRRDPISVFMKELVEMTPILKGRIEKISKLVGKKTEMIYTTNNLRQGIATFFSGDRRNGGKIGDCPENLKTILGVHPLGGIVEEQRKTSLLLLSGFFNTFAKYNESWARVLAQGDLNGESGIVASERPKWLLYNGTGLLLMTEMGHHICKLYPEYGQRMDWFGKLASQVPWDRNAAIWKGNVVQAKPGQNENATVVNQSRLLLVQALNNICDCLGLPKIESKKGM